MDQRTRTGGKESVWDYPRPPRVERTNKHLIVKFNDVIIAETRRGCRILETSHPPVYYFPPEDVKMEFLVQTDRHTFCEFKGVASYYTIKVGSKMGKNAAWTYQNPVERYNAIRSYVAFYANRVDSCYVDGELVIPQGGDFYGGWITSDIVGPYKGDPDQNTISW